jgi:DHA1 family bicyclomycin/chloramphenicol resistance-like MFS transporter
MRNKVEGSATQHGTAMLLALVTACLALQPLSTDVYLASLPHLVDYFDVSRAAVQQTLSLFVIGFAAAQMVVGPLSDRYGRRPVLLGGLALYVIASIVCAAAGSIAALIVGRILQAIGCCTSVVIARAVVSDAYAQEDGARVLARASSFMALVPLLGPIIGSWLQVTFGWRASFVLFTAVGLTVTVLAWSRLHETHAYRNKDALQIGALVRAHQQILRAPVFWAYTLPGALSYASIFVFISGASFALIDVLDMPTQYFGYAWAVSVCGYLAGTMICRRLLGAWGIARTLSFGTTVAAIAGVLFALAIWAGLWHWAIVVGGQFLVMFGHGINFPCAQAGAVSPFSRQAGTAAGLLGTVTMLVAFAIGTWIGSSREGALYPMALAAAGLGCGIFLSARLLKRIGAERTPQAQTKSAG